LKHGWTRFSRCASALLLLCLVAPSAQLQAQLRTSASANRDSPAPNKSAHRDDDATHRNDELTLAGLRPGRDAIAKAERLFAKPASFGDSGTGQTWRDDCRHESLSIITDSAGTILEVRVAEVPGSKQECANAAASRWITGHGLVIGDPSSRVLDIYGQPGSRGPSTKGGQRLELLYYAFDWAGPDVPQVMTVLCTPDKEGKPGRVVEITLAAPSL
jgi:hypothetical protein